MAAPTFVSQGTAETVTGAATVVWPTGHQADDIGILMVQTANQPPATPSGWTLIGSIGTGTAGAAGATALSVYWKRATSGAEASVAIPDVGDHIRARILLFRGCETSGSPIDGTPVTAVVATADAAVSIAMPTTAVAESFAVALVANATASNSNQTTVGSWSNAALTGFTRIANGNATIGVGGGGIDGGGGSKDVAGAIAASTSTLATASAQAKVSFALKPPVVAPPSPVTEGGIFVVTGVKAAAGVVSPTTMTLDTAAIQSRVTFALKSATPPANLPPVIEAIPAIVGAVGFPVLFPIVVTDPENDALSLTLIPGTSQVPNGAVVLQDEDSGLYSFDWTPTAGQAGGWDFALQVTDGTNTVESAIHITVQATPDTTLLDLAKAIASRAATDLESARALANMLDQREQMNAKVIHVVRELVVDLEGSRAYAQNILDQLEEETDPT